MSSGNSYPRCAVEIRGSRRLLVASFLLTALAVVAPWLSSLMWPLALVFSAAAIPVSIPLFRWARGELSGVIWQAEGRWMLTERGGDVHEEARLMPGIHLGAGWMALRWQCVDCERTFRAAFLKDNCDANALRQLSVRLRVTPDQELFGSRAAEISGQ